MGKTGSFKLIETHQQRWAGERTRDSKREDYLVRVEENLFSGELHAQTRAEFKKGDGSELGDSGGRPAKMRALVSSSALAVNFFDPWRDSKKRELLWEALRLPSPTDNSEIGFRFEYKTEKYPVGPRTPNLDLLFQQESGEVIGVESKFAEPYRSDDGHGGISARYFPKSTPLWERAGLAKAQRIAERLRPEWIYLDVPQLLKHMLGLACDPKKPSLLLYLWFDTKKDDAKKHRDEVERFTEEVSGEQVKFRGMTYQELFEALPLGEEPAEGWRQYMEARYFKM